MQVSSDWKEFIQCLSARNVDFILVGGHAVAFHGLPRLTKDIDFFVRCDRENADRIVEALKDFGFASLRIDLDDLVKPGAFILLGHPPNRIDLITEIDAVGFEEAWDLKVAGEFDGLKLWVISKDLLVRNKLAAGRPQDKADAERLTQLDRDALTENPAPHQDAPPCDAN